MNVDSPEMKAFFDRLKADTKKAEREDISETLAMAAIGGGLAFWAYGSVAHTILFAFVIFAISAVGNRVLAEMRKQHALYESRSLIDKH